MLPLFSDFLHYFYDLVMKVAKLTDQTHLGNTPISQESDNLELTDAYIDSHWYCIP